MKRITLAPTLAIIAMLLACYGFTTIKQIGGLWIIRDALLVSLPLLAIVEIISFSHDLMKMKGRILSCTYAPRLVIHAAGIILALWILWVTGVLIYLQTL
jgi:hypothetical protein